MNIRLYRAAIPLLLALAACRPGVAEYTKSEAPTALKLDSAGSQFAVRFIAGTDRLAPGESARLRQLALDGHLRPTDRIEIAAAGGPDLAAAREAALSRELLRYDIVADVHPLFAVAANHATVIVVRHLVTLPACPNWSQQPYADFTNQPSSNFGCATAIDLGLMAASPSDLVSGRPVGPALGPPAVIAVQRYLADKVELPSTTQALPLPSTSTGGGGSPGGGGSQQ
ncbi:MAG TPA: CpaD family pilus assembly lipoprotein [Stellaceae bacterium]|nr:CpaD family pilus assembly lipoprotein [Stellaceae bacterium]